MAEVLSNQKKHIMSGSMVLYGQMRRCEKELGSQTNYGHRNSFWTMEENKIFEKSLAMYDSKTPDRWQKIVDMIPGKTVLDAFQHYKDLEDDVNCIEAGLVDIPSYNTFPFTLELGDDYSLDGFKQFGNCTKKGGKGCEQERKKGIPWTEEEHRLFLLGLEKYGKGDWRNISRNMVVTKTPTQVASHAQKYFIRLSSGSKDKRRSSIHDITTANVTDKRTPSLSRSPVLSTRNSGSNGASNTTNRFSLLFDPNQTSERALNANVSRGIFSQLPSYAASTYANNFNTQHFYRNVLQECLVEVQNSGFQMQPSIHSNQG